MDIYFVTFISLIVWILLIFVNKPRDISLIAFDKHLFLEHGKWWWLVKPELFYKKYTFVYWINIMVLLVCGSISGARVVMKVFGSSFWL